MKRLLVFGFAVLLTVAAQAEQVLRVGITPNSPPLIYKKGKQIAGLEAEFARRLAAGMKTKLQFVEMPFDQLLPALDADKIDIVMSGMTVTAIRAPMASFCTPYVTSGQALLIRAADAWTFAYPEVIFAIKTRIGVEKGTIAETLVKRRCPQATVKTYSSTQAAANALKDKQVDVVISDAPIVWLIAAQESTSGLIPVRRFLTQENLAWAVSRDDTSLRKAANAALAQWTKDGTLLKLLKQYLPFTTQ